MLPSNGSTISFTNGQTKRVTNSSTNSDSYDITIGYQHRSSTNIVAATFPKAQPSTKPTVRPTSSPMARPFFAIIDCSTVTTPNDHGPSQVIYTPSAG